MGGAPTVLSILDVVYGSSYQSEYQVHCDLSPVIDLTSISLQKHNLKGHKSHALGCNLDVNLEGNTVQCPVWV